jgi:phage terminase large subunit-like protein
MPKFDLSNKDTIQELRELAKSDLYIFAKGIVGFDWLTPKIHRPLCRLLELYEGYNESLRAPKSEYESVIRDCFRRMRKELTDEELEKLLEKGLKRLIIVLPRGWLKTTLCSQAYPMWRAIRNPEYRGLLTQNTYTNACAKLNVMGSTFKSNMLFKAIFSDILPDKSCTWKAESMTVKRTKAFAEGTFEAAGSRTAVVSRHYNEIIEDDTVAPEKDDLTESNLMPTQDEVNQAIGWHRLVLPLLNNPSRDRVLIVATRWFEKDLVSWVQENENYISYQRSCRETEDGQSSETGEITYPERFDEEVLEGLRAAMGPYLFSCLYYNKPVRSKDMVFLPEWFKYYETEPQNLICYTTADPAGDPEDTAGEPDYNVVVTCGKDIYSGKVYILSYTREKCSPGRLIDIIFDHVHLFNPVIVGLETVQYQKSLQYWIREKQRNDNVYFTIKALTHTKRSKGQRILGLQPIISNGSLLFRSHMKDLISELLVYPLGKNDDIADALASQLELWQVTSTVSEEKQKMEKFNPLSFTSVVNELRSRNGASKSVNRDMLGLKNNNIRNDSFSKGLSFGKVWR